MPVTFATYAIGMLALCGFPLLFSGFWSKDEILHAAHDWQRRACAILPAGLFGALLTAFYMTRQVSYVFFGTYARARARARESARDDDAAGDPGVLCGGARRAIGTPAWPWFRAFLDGSCTRQFDLARSSTSRGCWR